jgi:hypothetical protein
MELTRYFSFPGSCAFVSMLNWKEVVLPNWHAVSWLVNQSSEEESTMRQSGRCADRLVSDVAISLLFRPLYQLLSSMTNSRSIGHCGLLKLLEQLRGVQNVAIAGSLYRLDDLEMDTYIIALGKAINRSTSNETKDQKNIRALLRQMKKWVNKSCVDEQHRLPTLPISPAPQPRRDTANAFALLPTAINVSLAHAVRIAYCSFRLKTMRLSDWYEEYFTMVASYPGVSSNESLFFVAVEELIRCGFVHVLSSHKEEPVYERIICWASMDDDLVQKK